MNNQLYTAAVKPVSNKSCRNKMFSFVWSNRKKLLQESLGNELGVGSEDKVDPSNPESQPLQTESSRSWPESSRSRLKKGEILSSVTRILMKFVSGYWLFFIEANPSVFFSIKTMTSLKRKSFVICCRLREWKKRTRNIMVETTFFPCKYLGLSKIRQFIDLRFIGLLS